MSSNNPDPSMASRSIIILGGGIGGLTLGRCLKHKGIASIIYDRAPAKPRHTYGMTLEAWAYSPLLKMLGLDEQSFRHKLAVDGSRVEGVGKYRKGDRETENPSRFRANRHKFESMLREGLEVVPEHQLSKAVLDDDQKSIELSFENGSSLQSSSKLVIDATGVHSPLRSSLLPNISPDILPYVVFNGKRYISPELFNEVYGPALGDGNTFTIEPKRAGEPRLEVTVNDHRENGDVSVSYVYSRKARADGPDPLHRPDRAKAEATEINEEFYKEVRQVLKNQDLPPIFRDVFDVEKLRQDRLLHWLMRSILVPREDLEGLLSPKIIMLGDASHATPILGGKGANSAIVDAIKLSELISSSDGDEDLIRKFYEARWQTWKDEVEASKTQIEEIHAVQGARL